MWQEGSLQRLENLSSLGRGRHPSHHCVGKNFFRHKAGLLNILGLFNKSIDLGMRVFFYMTPTCFLSVFCLVSLSFSFCAYSGIGCNTTPLTHHFMKLHYFIKCHNLELGPHSQLFCNTREFEHVFPAESNGNEEINQIFQQNCEERIFDAPKEFTKRCTKCQHTTVETDRGKME